MSVKLELGINTIYWQNIPNNGIDDNYLQYSIPVGSLINFCDLVMAMKSIFVITLRLF